MRQAVFEVRVIGSTKLDEFIDLGLADGCIALAILSIQGGNGQFEAHGLAILVIVQSIANQRFTKIGQAQVVLPRHALHGLVELSIGNRDAASFCFLHQNGIGYQNLQHLPLQYVFAWHAPIRATEFNFDQFDAIGQVALGNDAFIDDDDNAVKLRFLGDGGG